MSASNDSHTLHLQRSFDAATTLVDFYGFGDKGDRTVEELEERLMQEIHAHNPRRAFPYVQKYEFEGLLFSDTAAFGTILDIADHSVETLAAVRRQFATPEDINDDPNGAPSKRIAQAVAGYRKRGPQITREAGLETIRAECPRFHAWLTRLEGLADAPQPPRSI